MSELAVRPLPVPGRLVVVLIALVPLPIALSSGYGLLWLASYASVGALLAIRRPGHPIGWILLGLGRTLALQSGEMDVTPDQFTDGSLTAPQQLEAWLLGGTTYPLFALFTTLMTIFPSGRMPTGHWRTVLGACICFGVLASILVAFAPVMNVNMPGYPDGAMVANPMAIAPDAAFWSLVTIEPLFFVSLAGIALAAISLVIRYRASRGVERAQIRWVATAVSALVVAMLGGLVAYGVIGNGIAYIPSILAFCALPVSIGIAVLRYRLYDIDRVVSRTIGWTLSSGLVAAMFVLLIVGLQAVLAPLTSENTLAVAASTLVAAAVFQPLRRRVQTAVDRRFDRARVDAQLVLDGFAAGLRDDTSHDALDGHLASVVQRSMQPRSVAVWTRQVGGTR